MFHMFGSSGQALVDLLNYAKENEFAIPGVNVVNTSSVNACMEAAKKAGGPVMVTFSRGGGQLLGTEVNRWHLVVLSSILFNPTEI